MKTKYLHQLILLAIAAAPSSVPGQAEVPMGLRRLKALTDTTLVGSKTSFSFADVTAPNPLIGQNNARDKIVAEREFDAIQPVWYPNSGMGPDGKVANFPNGESDLKDLNEWINWAYKGPERRPAHRHQFFGPNFYFPPFFTTQSYTGAGMDTLMRNLISDVMQSNATPRPGSPGIFDTNATKVTSFNMVNEALDYDAPSATTPAWPYQPLDQFWKLEAF